MKITLMRTNTYKSFFTALLVISGLLLLASAGHVLACTTAADCAPGQSCNSAGNCVTGSNNLPTGANNLPAGGGQGSATLPNWLGVTTISQLILKIVDFLMTLALPFAALMLVWAGFQFATAQGSEEKLRVAKRNLIWTVLGVLVILAAKEIVSYITDLLTGTGTSSLMTKINNLLTQVYVLLFLLVTVYFFWGVVQFVRASGSGGKEMEDGKRHMVWGIIGMAIMAGAWGIVAIIQSVLQ